MSKSKEYSRGDLVFYVLIFVATTVAVLSIIFGTQIDHYNQRWVDWDNCLESGAEATFCNDTFKAPEGAR